MKGLVLALLLGCGTASPTREPTRASLPTKPASAPLASAPPAIACPDEATIRGALIRDAYPRTEKIHNCVPGKFPQPAFAVVGSSAPGPYATGPAVLAIVNDTAREVIASSPSDCPYFEHGQFGVKTMCEVLEVAVADLDGDGTDELLIQTNSGPYYAPWLSVYSVAGTTLKKRLTFHLVPGSPVVPGCRYDYSVGDPDIRGKRLLQFSGVNCTTCTIDLSNSTEC